MIYTVSGLTTRGAPTTFKLRAPFDGDGDEVVLLREKEVLARIPIKLLDVDCTPANAADTSCQEAPEVAGLFVDLPRHRVFLTVCRENSSNCSADVVEVSLPSLKVRTVGSIMGSMTELSSLSPSARYLAVVEAMHESAFAAPPTLYVIDLKTRRVSMKDFASEEDDEACATGKGPCPPEILDVSWAGNATVIVDVLQSARRGKKWTRTEQSVRLPVRSLESFDE